MTPALPHRSIASTPTLNNLDLIGSGVAVAGLALALTARPCQTSSGCVGSASMRLPRSPRRLAGTREVAEILRVSRQRVHQLLGSDGFPKPIDTIAAGAVWWKDEIERWAERNRPTAGAPPAVPARDPDRPQDDPWDANAVRYLLRTPEGRAWTRGTLMECLREQSNRKKSQPDKVAAAAALAERYKVERRTDPGDHVLHFFRNDGGPDAPDRYPRNSAERRAWLAQERRKHDGS